MCCVLSSQWDQAVQLAEEYKYEGQYERLLHQYAQEMLGKGRRMEAAELFRKAQRHPDAAKILSEMAQEEVQAKANPQRARALFVLAASEVQKFRDKTLTVKATGTMATMATRMEGKTAMGGKGTMAGAGGARGTMATMATLDGLMQVPGLALLMTHTHTHIRTRVRTPVHILDGLMQVPGLALLMTHTYTYPYTYTYMYTYTRWPDAGA